MKTYLNAGCTTLCKVMEERRKLKESRKLESKMKMKIWKQFRDEKNKDMDIVALGDELTIAECKRCASESGGDTITQQLLGIQLLDEYLRKTGRSSVPKKSRFRRGWITLVLEPIRTLNNKDFDSLIERYLNAGCTTLCKLMKKRRKPMMESSKQMPTKKTHST